MSDKDYSSETPDDSFIFDSNYSASSVVDDGTNSEVVCGCMKSDESYDIQSHTSSEVLYDSVVNYQNYDSEEEEVGVEVEEFDYSKIERSKLIPFNFKWSFGININTPILNLSTNESTDVFYSVANKAVLYDYTTRTIISTHYHKNSIVAATTGETGKWVVTSDIGRKSKIVFMDSTNWTTTRTIYNPQGDEGAFFLTISPNGKYLISVHSCEEEYLIKFWLWTFGKNEPHDSFNWPGKNTVGKPVKIEFHPNEQEYIMFAFEKQIIFFNWNEKESCIENITDIKIRTMDTPITDCVLLQDCHEAFASTTRGYILVFGSAPYAENWSDHALDNNKCYVKGFKVSTFPIVCLAGLENKILMCVTTHGYIRFFDNMIRLLHWHTIPKIPNITKINFHLLPRKFQKRFSLKNDYFNKRFSANHEDLNYTDIENFEETENLDGFHEWPVVVRNFIATTEDGNLYFIDIMNNFIKSLAYSITSPVASIDCYNEGSYLVVAYENESISLFDYQELKILVTDRTITEKRINDNKPNIKATFVKYSPECVHLAMGNSIGEIWFLTVLMKPADELPYKYSECDILRIAFSEDSQFMACYDSSDLLFVLKYGSPRWTFLGKMRSHCKKIRDLIFKGTCPSKIFTIGEDRYLIEYDVNDGGTEQLRIKSRFRIDQSGVPQSFLYYPYDQDIGNYFIIANDQHKYKLIHESDKVCRSVSLGPAFGCFDKLPLQKIELLPGSEESYMIFSNESHLGIQLLPADGNPYKFTGVMVNPHLKQFIINQSGEHVFTCGTNDYCVMMWEINTLSVHILEHMGGTDLEPYFCLIDGGSTGWVYKEMQDLFCYMQILNQGDFYKEQKFGEFINLTELPDLLRSCGFYPSEYEIKEIFNEVYYTELAKTGKTKEKITFMEFVKLFINHKPPYGILLQEFREKFETLFEIDEQYPSIDRETFLEFLTTYGEPFTEETAEQCFEALSVKRKTTSSTTDHILKHLPKEITFKTLARNMLGILPESVYEKTQERILRDEKEREGKSLDVESKISNESSI